MLKAPGTILLILRCDGPVSSVAFTFSLRPHIKDGIKTQRDGERALQAARKDGRRHAAAANKVGRCRLTLSNPI